MTVYEATTKQQFQKILDFINSQPTDSFSKYCWNRVGTYRDNVTDMRLIDFLKDKIRFVIGEDKEGNIRVIWGARIERDHVFGAAAFLLMDEKDYREGNVEYLKEVFDSQVRWIFNKDVKQGIFWTSEKHLDFSKRICGESLEILEEIDSNLYGKLWRVRVDYSKYLEINRV